jgi:hypothetical protein
MNRYFLLIVCGIGLTLTGCEDAMLAVGEMGAMAEIAEADEVSLDEMNGPEAREWLSKNENESALASNRFGPTEQAVRFVDELYRTGAIEVIVPQESIEDDGFGMYSDSLVVVLPKDPTKRRQVLTICDREARREGLDPGEEDGSDRVFLWWD